MHLLAPPRDRRQQLDCETDRSSVKPMRQCAAQSAGSDRTLPSSKWHHSDVLKCSADSGQRLDDPLAAAGAAGGHGLLSGSHCAELPVQRRQVPGGPERGPAGQPPQGSGRSRCSSTTQCHSESKQRPVKPCQGAITGTCQLDRASSELRWAGVCKRQQRMTACFRPELTVAAS